MEKYWELKKTLPNQANQEVINEFLLSLKLENRSDGTITHYRYFLERFFGDIKEDYSSLTSETILQWFLEHQSHVKEATLHSRLAVLSSFYNFCVIEEHISKSPMKSRWYPRLPHPIPKYLEKDDIAKTRLQIENVSIRNQLLVEFMLVSGCRVGEVNNLNWEDVDLENRTACVVGKGKKIRHVHFTDKCAVLFERYLTKRKIKSGALFVTTTGKRLGIRRIQVIIYEIGELAALSKRLHPHRFRHTFATELLAKGAELSFIGDELGHSQVASTLIYARLPKREIVSLYRKYMG
ncbi:tyrosine-type recombinase/integrase [Bacillus sp. JJ664]